MVCILRCTLHAAWCILVRLVSRAVCALLFGVSDAAFCDCVLQDDETGRRPSSRAKSRAKPEDDEPFDEL